MVCKELGVTHPHPVGNSLKEMRAYGVSDPQNIMIIIYLYILEKSRKRFLLS
jgi:hypothetical protein